MRDNFTAIRLLLALAYGREEFNLPADVLQLRVFGKPVQQFNDELFVAHKNNLAKFRVIAKCRITVSNFVQLFRASFAHAFFNVIVRLKNNLPGRLYLSGAKGRAGSPDCPENPLVWILESPMVVTVGIMAGTVIRKTAIRMTTTAAAAIVPENTPGGDDHGDEAKQVENHFHA